MTEFRKGWQQWAAIIMLVVMAACGGSDPGEGTEANEGLKAGEIVERSRSEARAAAQREAQRQSALVDAEADFSFFRYRVDLTGALPEACLVFSSALAPETDYSPFIEFRPAFRPALSVEGRELCIGGLSFGEERTAILKSGLPAGDGQVLAAGEELVISFEDRPAYVGFKGGGVVLPRLEADGLPLETVNVDAVRLTVSRVGDRTLAFKSITGGRNAPQGQRAYLYGDERPDDVAEALWTGTMPVTSQRNEPVVTVFPLADIVGELKPGAYFVRVEDARALAANQGPPASAVRWIMMTDLALTAFRGEHGLDVTLRSLQTGQAVQAARVELIAQNNTILASGQSGSDGRVQFAKPLMSSQGNTAPRLVLAYGDGGDFAVLDLDRAPVDLASEAVGGRLTQGNIDAYAYLDRGIYRPGEEVDITVLLRERSGRALSGRAGALVIHRPNGLEAWRQRFSETSAGGLTFTYPVPRGAARGLWRASVQVDGVGTVGETSFSVEDFIPQRIKVEIEGETAPALKANEIRSVDVDARFLYGAPGAGLVVKSKLRVQPDPSPFSGYDGFQFGKHDETFRERIITLPDLVADGAGKANLRLNPRGAGEESTRPLRLNVVVDVLEPGGRAVSESARIPYRPKDLYLGVKPGFEGRAGEGEALNFETVALDGDGAAVSRPVNWSLIAIDYHYDWYRENGNWRWRRSRTVRTINEGQLVTPEGGAAALGINPLEWGRYELLLADESGHEASYGFHVGWGGASEDGVEAPDRVALSGPEEAPRAGQQAEIAILPAFDGEAQIVVATDRVLSVQTQPVSVNGTRLTLPVTEAWGEGAYVMVTVYSKRNALKNAKPKRAVGVTYVPVDLSRRTFALTINTQNDVVRPGREHLVTVDIEGGPGEPVYLTLAAVDEGILRLTKFASPDPVGHFFGRKALGVDLLDDYGRLLNPNLGLPGQVRTGGDQLGGEGLSVVPTRSIALFSGLVEVGRSGKALIRFDVPDFNGELRLMAVAWSRTGLGAASRQLTVRDPVPSELILPRFMAPGDEAVAVASIDNVTGSAGRYDAMLATRGGVTTAIGTVSRELLQGQRVDGPIRIEADATGVSDLTLSVEGPGGFEIERTYQIETRSAFLPVSQVSRTLMQPGETWTPSDTTFADFVPGSGELSVSFSHLPVDATALYASLARYPYGCTEQAVSRALPLLYSDQLVAMVPQLEGGETGRDRVQETVNLILNRQSADGAFGLWREGDGHASPWLGAYTVDFLARAKTEGYVVPNEALSRAYASLRNVAQGDAWRVYGYTTDVYEEARWHSDTTQRLMHRSSAYALYVLARAGQADVSRLRYLHDNALEEIKSPLALAHLGAGLAHMGDRSRATRAFNAALAATGYRNTGDYYQTPLRDLAGILALAAETEFGDMVTLLSNRLGEDTPEPERLTTQEKAQLLLAVNAFGGGEEALKVDVSGLGPGNDNDPRYRLSAVDLDKRPVFELGGEAPVFRTVIARGAPARAPRAASEKLSIVKTIRGLKGQQINLSNVRQGDQLVVTLTLTPQERRVNPVIVADLLPAGFEIETVLRPADGYVRNGDPGAFAWVGQIDAANTAEARDDRYVAAIDVRNTPQTLAYIVRAVTPGDFVLPGAVAEDMYRPDVFARSAAGRVRVVADRGSPGGSR